MGLMCNLTQPIQIAKLHKDFLFYELFATAQHFWWTIPLRNQTSVCGNKLRSCLCHAKLQDERQLAWDQREVELERQLEQHEKHPSEILSGTEKVTMFTVSETCIRGSFLVNALLRKHLWRSGSGPWELHSGCPLQKRIIPRQRKEKFTVNHVYRTNKASSIVYFKIDWKAQFTRMLTNN